MGFKMKFFKLAIIFSLAALAMHSIYPNKEIITITNINGELSILFNKTCEVSAMSIDDERGNNISEIVYSEAPGYGPVFKKNSYFPIRKNFKTSIESAKKYTLRISTDCLGNRQIPVFRTDFSSKSAIKE